MTWLIILLNNGQEAILDEDDYERLSEYKWRAHKNENNIYVQRTVRTGKNTKTIFMHREIMGAKLGQMVDHINRNGLDNRRCNLRFVTPSQSSANARPIKGFKGVSKEHGGWRAAITKDGIYKRLGSFDNPIDAAIAYDEAARELFGEYACTNAELGLLSSDVQVLLK